MRARTLTAATIVLLSALVSGCRVESNKSANGDDVKIATPFGGMSVKTDSAADKVYATKDAAVKDARESGKDYYGSSKGYATAEAVEKGKTSQAHLEETYLGKDKMNMDQVRDLLNKNH